MASSNAPPAGHWWRGSLRAQILLVVAAAVIPLGSLAVWLTFNSVRAGDRWLQQQLEQSADRIVEAVNARWEHRQSDLLYLARNAVTTSALARGAIDAADSAFLGQLVSSMQGAIPSVELLSSTGQVLWSASIPLTRDRSQLPSFATPTFMIDWPVADSISRRVGTVRAAVALASVVPTDSGRPNVPGARLGVRVVATGASLVRLQRDLAFPTAARFEIGSEEWRATTRLLAGPGLELGLAAPLTPYVAPFRAAGRVGLVALLAVTVAVVLLAVGLTSRLTHPLRELAAATERVSRGELGVRVQADGPNEVRSVATAFNVMSENLRTTLDRLSEQSAMAAVGEFAAALSHDVRNALTSIKVDVERAVHRPTEEARGTPVLTRVLNNVARLESLVSGALRMARPQGRDHVAVDLRLPMAAAEELVAGAFAAVPATLRVCLPDRAVHVRGDAKSLEQLLANLLFNAAQAVRPGGAAQLALRLDEGAAVMEIADDGIGMDEGQVARLERPFGSTKANGTGLGLPIARQIVAAHRGTIAIQSRPGCGTTVVVRLAVQ
jgi:signal transduction histidine kinase